MVIGAPSANGMNALAIATLLLAVGCVAADAQREHQDLKDLRFGANIIVSGGTATLTVDYGRPLQRAVELLEGRYGWHISYEDPPHLSDLDVWDVTDPGYAAAHPGVRALAPKASLFALEYSVKPATDVPEETPGRVLSALLDAHNASGNPGRFRLLTRDGMFQIVPTATRVASGALEPVDSPLDTKITFVRGDRTVMETVFLIAEEITKASNVRVRGPGFPSDLLVQVRVIAGANGEPARDALARVLPRKGHRVTWSLLCDPDPSVGCALNLHAVMQEVTGRDGRQRLEYVDWPQ